MEAKAETTTATIDESLGVSQSWDIIDTSEAKQTAEPPVDMELVREFASVSTVLYETDLRQLLIDDLEELECFLKQRQAEFTSKESIFFAVYQDSYL